MSIVKIYKRLFNSMKFIWKHPLIKTERLRAVIRYVRFHLKYRYGQECRIPFLNNFLIIIKGEGSQAHYFTYLSDFEEMLFLLHYLNEDDKFIDIGANIGTYSILSATMVGCETVSFEPSDQIFSLLEKNVIINNVESKINLFKYALGAENQSMMIGYKGAMTYITNNNELDLQEIEVKRLDDFVDYGSLIKIDVEGYEEFVLEGAEKVLSNPKTGALIIELASYNRYGSSNDRVHEALNKYGFFPIKYLPYKREFTKLKTYRKDQFNTIYIRDEKFTKNRLINSIKYNVGNQWI